MLPNQDLRNYAKSKHVKMYSIAQFMGIAMVTLDKRLRNDFTDEEREEFKNIVDAITPYYNTKSTEYSENSEFVKLYAHLRNIPQHRIASAMGISEMTLLRRFRKGLTPEQRDEYIKLIDELFCADTKRLMQMLQKDSEK